jgi:hypothetical protein
VLGGILEEFWGLLEGIVVSLDGILLLQGALDVPLDGLVAGALAGPGRGRLGGLGSAHWDRLGSLAGGVLGGPRSRPRCRRGRRVPSRGLVFEGVGGGRFVRVR